MLVFVYIPNFVHHKKNIDYVFYSSLSFGGVVAGCWNLP